MLDLIASTLSNVIFEHENLNMKTLYNYLNNYIMYNYDNITPNERDYIIDKAFEIYEKI